jgi:ADP-ribose pyrophosphatase YjhB (NUDIX family)
MADIAVYDMTGKRIGQASKYDVHQNGLWHCSVLLLIVRHGRMLIYQRGADQSWSLCWDIPGGHQDADDETILETANRELSEEVIFADVPDTIDATSTLMAIGLEGCMVSESPTNRERSSVYVIQSPSDDAQVQDQGEDGQTLQRASCWITLADLRRTVADGSLSLADGLRRFLERLDGDSRFRTDVYRSIGHGRWRIGFGCTRLGEPGCGCPDGDFYAEEIFEGSYKEGKAYGARICRDRYDDDFVCWLEPIGD